jgi:hypothetical protein
MFILNKIKSEESFIHKDSNINTKTQKKLFSADSPILADTQNTTCTNINTSSYIQYLKSLGNNFLSKPQISNITDLNINNINFSDDNNKDNEIKDFKLNSNNYLGKKRKIHFNLIKKSNESNLFKTYIFDPPETRSKIFRINKDKLNSSKINKTSGINEGIWSFDEHLKFIEGIILFKKDWYKIAKYVGTRGLIQVRSHSQKFYLKLKKIKNNNFGINFQNKNIKNIFDIIYLLKEKNNSNNNEKEYIINALISLTKSINLHFLVDDIKNKTDDNYNDCISANENNIIDNKTRNSKVNINIFFDNKKNDEINKYKEKEEKTPIDNNDIFKNCININISNNINLNNIEIEDDKEDKLQYEYINTPENQSSICNYGVSHIEDEFNLSDTVNFERKNTMFIKNQMLSNLNLLSNYFS